MAASGVTVTVRVNGGLSTKEESTWSALAFAFAGELAEAQQVELIITDEYERVAGELALLSPIRANEAMTATDYNATKPAGARAVARTIPLPNDCIAVVADARLARLSERVALAGVLHEAQHVRLQQNGDAAWGVHRKVTFALPDNLQFEFIWLAETLLDEFRCELEMHRKGLGSADSTWIEDYAGIAALFYRCRSEYQRSGDLMGAYLSAFAALERLCNYLAYGAACIVMSQAGASGWTAVSGMRAVLRAVSDVPSPSMVVAHAELLTTVLTLAHALRAILRDLGFDLYLAEVGVKYFTTAVS